MLEVKPWPMAMIKRFGILNMGGSQHRSYVRSVFYPRTLRCPDMRRDIDYASEDDKKQCWMRPLFQIPSLVYVVIPPSPQQQRLSGNTGHFIDADSNKVVSS